MLLHTAHLGCHPDHVEAFKARLLLHARTTLEAAPGCRRFDVHEEKGDPTLFLLIEVYDDQAALDLHRDSVHFKAFRAETAAWVVERRWWFWEKLG
jgi:(4S)-4-hydroxy-5-phosphonooxypentane-2,3-dione isomerase